MMLISSGVMSLAWPLMVTRRCHRVDADVHTTERCRLFPKQHGSCEGVVPLSTQLLTATPRHKTGPAWREARWVGVCEK